MHNAIVAVIVTIAMSATPIMAAVSAPAGCFGTECGCHTSREDHHAGPLPADNDDCCRMGTMTACRMASQLPQALPTTSDRTEEPNPLPLFATSAISRVDSHHMAPGGPGPASHTSPNPPPRYLLVCALII